ncbi:uncharacterized protein LOC141911873 [Tubulanus polymorphus]|uniref:uncharacterized protein LOC141911873 n=1 Tax=Tubulanus polymorphus TaxID=672921 RepID=UPI003DA53C2F
MARVSIFWLAMTSLLLVTWSSRGNARIICTSDKVTCSCTGDEFTKIPDDISTNISEFEFDGKVESINSASFAGFSNLSTIKVEGVGLRSVTDSPFFQMKKLKNLYLAYNNITIIPSATLVGNGYLETIDFRNNSIISIESFSFVHATSQGGGKADFSFNRLQSLNDYIFKLSAFESLDFSHNRLRTISKFSLRGIRGLKKLDLRFNELSVLSDEFDFLDELEILSLSYNKLLHVSADIFKSTINLRELTLRGNRIVSIGNFLANLKQPKLFRSLDVTNSSILCNCESKWLKKFIEQSPGKVVNARDVMCTDPMTKPLLEMSESEFAKCFKPVITKLVQYDWRSVVCRVKGDPFARIYWISPFRTELQSDRNYHIYYSLETEGILVINRVAELAYGDYTCVAENSIGSVNRTINVKTPVELEREKCSIGSAVAGSILGTVAFCLVVAGIYYAYRKYQSEAKWRQCRDELQRRNSYEAPIYKGNSYSNLRELEEHY